MKRNDPRRAVISELAALAAIGRFKVRRPCFCYLVSGAKGARNYPHMDGTPSIPKIHFGCIYVIPDRSICAKPIKTSKNLFEIEVEPVEMWKTSDVFQVAVGCIFR